MKNDTYHLELETQVTDFMVKLGDGVKNVIRSSRTIICR